MFLMNAGARGLPQNAEASRPPCSLYLTLPHASVRDSELQCLIKPSCGCRPRHADPCAVLGLGHQDARSNAASLGSAARLVRFSQDSHTREQHHERCCAQGACRREQGLTAAEQVTDVSSSVGVPRSRGCCSEGRQWLDVLALLADSFCGHCLPQGPNSSLKTDTHCIDGSR